MMTPKGDPEVPEITAKITAEIAAEIALSLEAAEITETYERKINDAREEAKRQISIGCAQIHGKRNRCIKKLRRDCQRELAAIRRKVTQRVVADLGDK